MNPLASRKQLLLAESELNRVLLMQEWQAMTDEVHALTSQAGTFNSIASAVVSLCTALAFCRRPAPAPASGRTSWWPTLLKGAGWVASVWSKFRAPAGGGAGEDH